MLILILTLCVFLVLIGLLLFLENLARMLRGRCCEGCRGCPQRGRCSVGEGEEKIGDKKRRR
ncbi:MAG: hypothetical protein DBX66_05145 [Clostridiales bacterium]|uniref:hypothetical protein n=1 Tax=Provencibacterium massiliense TaxID=1841868 RepID=UPI0009A69660|nr:hypothetical protein [Provencibacterium massiliense]PWM37572.1 MAG: hypothetical protein DBX66_05145 [Clostridiales bacterium]RGB66503.1 hypothetical protein DW086_08495 [Harryflintia acetispora]